MLVRCPHRDARGFTLIELLVTVSIVGILASLAVASFTEFKRRANDTLAISDVKNATTAYAAYLVDNSESSSPGLCTLTPTGAVLANVGGACDMLPGFNKSPGVWFAFDGGFWAKHCNGSLTNDSLYLSTFYMSSYGGGSIGNASSSNAGPIPISASTDSCDR